MHFAPHRKEQIPVPNQHPGIIAIGASAGGIPSLRRIVEQLPSTLTASVMVVVHIGQGASVLPKILQRHASVPCSHAVDGEPIRPGHIYVAPPDYHLLVRGDRLALSHGPREHHTRPAIDPLFMSAARSYGPSVIGIVLSGALSDGAAGLLAIKSSGGKVIVQDPEDALNEGMPRSALQFVEPDAVLPADEIAGAALRLFESLPPAQNRGRVVTFDQNDLLTERIQEDFVEQADDQRAGELTPFTCPDCGGTLWQAELNGLLSFRCHVGHTWGWEALAQYKSDQLESALWASVRLLVERATLNRQVSAHAREVGVPEQSERFDEQAERDQQYAKLIRDLIESFARLNGQASPESAEPAMSGE